MGRATPLSYFNAKQLVELLIARVSFDLLIFFNLKDDFSF